MTIGTGQFLRAASLSVLMTLGVAGPVFAQETPGAASATTEPSKGLSDTPSEQAGSSQDTLDDAKAIADAKAAVDTVDGFYSSLLSVWKKGQELGPKGRFDALEPAVEKAFDLPNIARLAVGPEWSGMSSETRAEIVDAFTRMTVANYAKNFSNYGGQSFKVSPDAAQRRSYLVVESWIERPKDEPVQINYVMREGDSGWQIADVLFNGNVSELTTRRSEFSSVLKKDGPEALIAKINSIADTALAS